MAHWSCVGMALPEIWWLFRRYGGSLELCWHGSSGDMVAHWSCVGMALPEIWWLIGVVLTWLFRRFGGSLELCWHSSPGDMVAHWSCAGMALPEIWWLIPRYNMECIGENVIIHGIFHVQ